MAITPARDITWGLPSAVALAVTLVVALPITWLMSDGEPTEDVDVVSSYMAEFS